MLSPESPRLSRAEILRLPSQAGTSDACLAISAACDDLLALRFGALAAVRDSLLRLSSVVCGFAEFKLIDLPPAARDLLVDILRASAASSAEDLLDVVLTLLLFVVSRDGASSSSSSSPPSRTPAARSRSPAASARASGSCRCAC
jgi:hypothetical protein